MFLKPFSISWELSYLDFLKQNYFIKLPDLGPKKVNLKGINRINSANFKEHKELTENDIYERNFREMSFSDTIMHKSEIEFAEKLLEARLAPDEDSEIKIEKFTFNDLGALFTIELFDLLWINEINNGELFDALEVIRDTMVFSEKEIAHKHFENGMSKYMDFLSNPSKNELLIESLKHFEDSLAEYKENPFSHFFVGLIYNRPSDLFSIEKSIQYFKEADKFSTDLKESYFSDYTDFILGWLHYVSGDIDKAIEYNLKSLEKEEIIIPEAYYNLAKYYAVKNDPENSIKHLGTVIENSDNFYSLKADIDDDFKNIRNELETYFLKLKGIEKDKIREMLKEFNIDLLGNDDQQDQS